jgi:serine/threonine protein kinase/tetratricopeptide (TPR) repeat protein
MPTCPDENLLARFVARQLDPVKRGELEVHLDECSTCLYVITEMARPSASTVADTPGARAELLGPGGAVDRYRIEDVLGEGGMGTVYLAHDTKLERRVALKVVRGNRMTRTAGRERMAREAKAMAKLAHTNVVTIYDTGEVGDRVYIAMELVDGVTLAAWLRESPRSQAEIVRAFVSAGRGLAAAHAVGVVHRDFKPENVLIGRTGRVAVTDFGLATATSVPVSETDAVPISNGPISSLTRAGTILGTPRYMSPEQRCGEKVDARSDQYSFAVALYEALFGAPPFAGETPDAIRDSRLCGRLRDPSYEVESGVPAVLRRALRRALATDPKERFGTLAELLDEIAPEPIAAEFDRPLPFDNSAPSPRASQGATQPAGSSTGRPRGLPGAWARRPTPAIALGASLVLTAAVVLGMRLLRPRAVGAPTASSMPSATPEVGPATTPTKVLVLGSDNRTGDALFDGTIDFVLRKALGRSPTISTLTSSSLGSLAAESDAGPELVDERLARKLLEREGGTVITVRGVAARKGVGYSVSITATNAKNGAVVFSGAREATDGDRVVPSVALLASDLRTALADSPPADSKLAEQTGLSSSVEADHELLIGTTLVKTGKYDEATVYLRRALDIDPRLVWAHWALGNVLHNLGRHDEASSELALAMETSDGLVDVDRMDIEAQYFEAIGAYDRAIPLLEELLEKQPANLHVETVLTSLCSATHQTRRALDLAQRTARDHPTQVIAWTNVVANELRSSNMEQAIQEAEKVLAEFPRPPPHVYGYLALAEALRGRSAEAANAYGKLLSRDASLASHGLADLALAEGRVADANALLVSGLSADIAHGKTEATARKRILLAETLLRRDDTARALEAAQKASSSPEFATLFAAAEIELAAHGRTGAVTIASRLV